MDTKLSYVPLKRRLQAGVLSLVSAFALCGHGATVWTGPNITWTKSTSTPSDTIVAGKVVLTRKSNNVLINTAAGETAAIASSPADTEWGFGNLSNFSTIGYQSMGSLRNGDLAARILNQPMVMHLVREDIYIAVKFTVWGQGGIGTVSYTRSTPALAVAPTVKITNPISGAILATPADVTLAANATVTGGTVTNVAFFERTTKLGSAQGAPFTFAATGLTAGAYAFKAVATAAGISSTSSVVNITVVSPSAVSLISSNIVGGAFSFHYTTDPGLRYIIEKSFNFADWTPLTTNVAAGSSAVFSEPVTGAPGAFYRVGLLPNP